MRQSNSDVSATGAALPGRLRLTVLRLTVLRLTVLRLTVRGIIMLFMVGAAFGFGAAASAATETNQQQALSPESLPDNCRTGQFILVSRSELTIQMVDVQVLSQGDNRCEVRGTLRVRYRDQEARPAAHGTVDALNRFVSSQINPFALTLAGLQLRVEEPVWDGENLRLLKAFLKAPDDLGGKEMLLGTPPRMNAFAGFSIQRGTPFPLMYAALGLQANITFEYDGRTDTVIWYGDGYLNPSKLAARYAGLKKLFGSATQPGQVGCGILIGVTLYTTASGQTQFHFWSPGMAPDNLPVSETKVFSNHPLSLAFAGVNSEPFTPAAVDDTGFGGGTLGFDCSPGIPIPGTPLRWTQGRGSLVLTPTVEKLQLEVVMTAPPEIRNFPLIKFVGRTDVHWAPDFVFEMAVRAYLLFLEMGGTSVFVSERDGVRFEFYRQEVLYTTRLGVRANASTVAATGQLGVGMRQAQYWQGCTQYPCGVRMCKKWGVPYPCGANMCTACISIPPTDIWLGSIAAEFGHFRRGSEQLWGIKGYTSLLNTYSVGVLVDILNTNVRFGDVSAYQLTSAVAMQQAKQRWQAYRAGALDRTALDKNFAFRDDGSVIVLANTDRATNPNTWSVLGTTDVVSYTNVLTQTDTLFQVSAVLPLAVSLISPTDDHITPQNYDRAPISDRFFVSYEVERTFSRERQLPVNAQQVRYISLTQNSDWETVDLYWEGQKIFQNVSALDAIATDYIDVTPGIGTMTASPPAGATQTGADPTGADPTNTANLRVTFEVITDTFYSVIAFDGDCWVCPLDDPNAVGAADNGPHLLVIAGDNGAPTALGQSRLRVLNLTQSHLSGLDLYIDGIRYFDNLVVQTPSRYIDIPSGERVIEVRSGTTLLFNEYFGADAAFTEGGVFTLIIGEVDVDADGVKEFAPTLLLDELHQPRYHYNYAVDQAPIGQWGVQLEGNVDDSRWMLSVIGATNPPILSDLIVVPHDHDSATFSWRLRSDYAPTKVSIYANPDTITQTLTLTDTTAPDGAPDYLVMMNFSGKLIAETLLTKREQLDGSLTSLEVDISALESGDYHFWAKFEDGVNPGISQYTEVGTLQTAMQSNGRRTLNVASAHFSPADWASGAEAVRIDRRDSFLVHSRDVTVTVALDAYVYQCPEFENGDCKDNAWELWEHAPMLLEFEPSSHPDTDHHAIYVDTQPLPLNGGRNLTTEVFDYGELRYQLYDLATGEPSGEPRIMFPYRTVEPGRTYYFAVSAKDSDTALSAYTAAFSITVPIGDFGLVAPSQVLYPTDGEIRTSLLVTMTHDLFQAIDLYHTSLDLPAGVGVSLHQNNEALAELLQPSRVALQTLAAEAFAAGAMTNRHIISRFADPEQARLRSSTVTVDVVIAVPPNIPPGIYTIPIHAQSYSLKRTTEIRFGSGFSGHTYLPFVTR